MITFERFGKLGRLGNHVMQLLSLRGIAERFNRPLKLPEWEYSKYFKEKIPVYNGPFPRQTKEPHFHHSWDWIKPREIINIDGYLQSPKYNWDTLEFDKEFEDSVLNKYRDWISGAVAISIRRGDFIDNPVYHQVPALFYISALIKYFDTNRSVIIFSDDIPYCKVHFECLPNVHFAEGSDIEQLCLMTHCSDYIISNSTFSYCGAFLSKNRGKVIRPEKNFGPEYGKTHDEKDFWPSDWIPHTPEKLSLTDFTFTIPISYDHPDRKQNADLCVCFLQRDLKTKIIIGEQGGDRFKYMSQWCEYMKFDYRAEGRLIFHRTKMLNEMAKRATTPFIVNYDCDNFIPPLQIYMMAQELRSGRDMVYPFDGQSARMPREKWFTLFEKYLDCGIVRDTKFMGKNGGKPRLSSVGHAIGFNKQSFFEGGMENEYFISFGPEDVERFERFSRLGFKVSRIDGAVYHMDHYCGPDSSRRNAYFVSNHDELKKIRAMTDQELREYVHSFPWFSPYTACYYETITDDATKSRDEVFKILEIKDDAKIIDCGCGLGQWGVGLKNYTGVDFQIPKDKLLISQDVYVEHDLRTPITLGRFDYVLCLEVAEHIEEKYADQLIENLCQLGGAIIFSAAIPNQGGTGHVNERWQSHWADKFLKHGYYPSYHKEIRDNKNICLWYRQNIVIYKKSDNGAIEDFVLPEYYEQITNNFKRSIS